MSLVSTRFTNNRCVEVIDVAVNILSILKFNNARIKLQNYDNLVKIIIFWLSRNLQGIGEGAS